LFLPSSICRFARVTGKVLPTHPVCLWPEETFIIYMLISVINSPQRHLPVVVGTSPLFFHILFFLLQRLKQIIKYIALPSKWRKGWLNQTPILWTICAPVVAAKGAWKLRKCASALARKVAYW